MINDLNHNNPEQNYTNISDIPDAISDLHRQLMLTKHIQSLKGDTMNIDQAAKLARELGKFLDQVQTEEIDFAKLNTIVPEELAEHWQVTLLFLEILSDFWPSILKDNNLIRSNEEVAKLFDIKSKKLLMRFGTSKIKA